MIRRPFPQVEIAEKLPIRPGGLDPKPAIKTNVFSTGSSQAPTIEKPPQQVQTGGFGDPRGVALPGIKIGRSQLRGRDHLISQPALDMAMEAADNMARAEWLRAQDLEMEVGQRGALRLLVLTML